MIPWHCKECQPYHIGYAPNYAHAYDALRKHLWERHGIDYDNPVPKNTAPSKNMDDNARLSGDPFIHIYNVVPSHDVNSVRISHERNSSRNYLRAIARIFRHHSPQHAKRIP